MTDPTRHLMSLLHARTACRVVINEATRFGNSQGSRAALEDAVADALAALTYLAHALGLDVNRIRSRYIVKRAKLQQ